MVDVRVTATNAAGSDWSVSSLTDTVVSDLDMVWQPASVPNLKYVGISCADTSDCAAAASDGEIAWMAPDSSGDPAWSAQTTSSGASSLSAISCPVAGTCVAVGPAGSITVGSPHGGTMKRVALPSGLAFTKPNLNAVACYDLSHCWAVGASGTILSSSDGGQSWNVVQPVTAVTLTGISCPTATTCFASGATGTVLKMTTTTSSGNTVQTWAPVPVAGYTQNLTAISCVTDCYATASNGDVLTNRSGSWRPQSAVYTLASLTFVNCATTTTSSCWIVASDGAILHTEDGTNWYAQLSPAYDDSVALASISCPTTDQCWAAGDSGELLAGVNPPPAPSVAGLASGAWVSGSGATVTITPVQPPASEAGSGFAPANAVASVDDGSSASVSCTTQCTTSVPYQADGSQSLEVAVIDAAGVTGPATTIPIRVDATDPTISISGSAYDQPDQSAASGTVSLDVSATDPSATGDPAGSSGVVSIATTIDGNAASGAPAASAPCPNGGCSLTVNGSIDLSGLSPGPHQIDVEAQDAAGNTSDTSWTLTVAASLSPPCTLGTPAPSHSPGTASTSTAAAQLAGSTSPDTVAASQTLNYGEQTIAPELQTAGSDLVSTGNLTSSDIPQSGDGSYWLSDLDDALCVSPALTTSAATAPDVVNQGAAVIANSDTSTNTILRPTATGVASYLQLTSASAPTSFTWDVSSVPTQSLEQLTPTTVAVVDTAAPADSSLTGSPITDPAWTADEITNPKDQAIDGFAAIGNAEEAVTDGHVIGIIRIPAATDASGQSVPTTLKVNASTNQLTVALSQSGGPYTYPITVTQLSDLSAATNASQAAFASCSFAVQQSISGGSGTSFGYNMSTDESFAQAVADAAAADPSNVSSISSVLTDMLQAVNQGQQVCMPGATTISGEKAEIQSAQSMVASQPEGGGGGTEPSSFPERGYKSSSRSWQINDFEHSYTVCVSEYGVRDCDMVQKVTASLTVDPDSLSSRVQIRINEPIHQSHPFTGFHFQNYVLCGYSQTECGESNSPTNYAADGKTHSYEVSSWYNNKGKPVSHAFIFWAKDTLNGREYGDHAKTGIAKCGTQSAENQPCDYP